MKYYKVIKENFLWEVDSILSNAGMDNGYRPVDDVFKRHDGNEYITSDIVENEPEYFQRVYKVDLATRVVYEVKERAKELLAKSYKD